MGTPSSLFDAIMNALSDILPKDAGNAGHIEAHVRDYLSQKFTPDLMDDPKVAELWKRIVGE